VYVFPTEDAIWLIETFGFEKRPAYQMLPDGRKIVTAMGYKVPVESFESCGNLQRIKIPSDIFEENHIWGGDKEDVKGRKAEKIVRAMDKRGLILVRPGLEMVSSDEQIKGKDFKSKPYDWQTKCDYKGGSTGSGNLYIQVEECNPYRLH